MYAQSYYYYLVTVVTYDISGMVLSVYIVVSGVCGDASGMGVARAGSPNLVIMQTMCISDE